MARAKKNTKAKTKAKPKARRTGPPWWRPHLDAARTWVTLSAFGWLTLVVGVVVGGIIGVPRLEAYASTANVATAPLEVTFVNRPEWMAGESLVGLVEIVRAAVSTDPLDRASLQAAHIRLGASGWFRSIRQVRRDAIGAVIVDGDFFVPLALIRERGIDFLVDVDGRLLPRQYAAGTHPSLVPIVGAQFNRPTALGETWAGADVAAGLRLVRLIGGSAWADRITTVDVSRYHDESLLFLVTRDDRRIRWGRAPGEERSGEEPADYKIEYLNRFFAGGNGVVAPTGRAELDLTGPIAVFR